VPEARAGPHARTLRPMHGMMSAAILICTFGAVAAACLYAAARAYLSGGRDGNAS